uniref:Cytochrome b n=1 Tax=Histiostoma feroniarum TaxID=334618 RepID=A0A2Z4MAM0_9ACAR|nr:cytochrome b [Histiostoma feroniarum]AWX53530.1 cytochrome b [Histiostoma feroniarum]
MKKKTLMGDPTITMVVNSLIKLPTPVSISYLWNMGFILGMILMMQIVTGLVLSMNYIPETNMAFESVMHTMRDIEMGWLMRYLHMNMASLFFMMMYVHISRGLYFESPKKMPMVWISGLLILLCSMGAAFLGYVLPWGQMSFWGATVITSMLSAIPYVGKKMTLWLWGNFSVSQPTLNRFFSMHFLLPLLLLVLIMAHLALLHKTGSSNPMGVQPNADKMKFFPYFMVKDMTPFMMMLVASFILISISPNLLSDVENFSKASMETTPTHIQPEWYFMFAYAILRSIPSKLGGVVAMLMSILILLVPMLTKTKMNKKHMPFKKLMFWMFVSTVIILTWVGMNPVEEPFMMMGQMSAVLYFSLILFM